LEKLTKEEIEKKKANDKRIAELLEKYVIRNFKTTSESFKFMKKIAKVISEVPNLEEIKDEDIIKLFDVFDEKTIKYVISTFVLVRATDDEKKNIPVNYEKEFIGEFESLIVLFMLTVEKLVGKSNGEKKPPAPKEGQKIQTKKR